MLEKVLAISTLCAAVILLAFLQVTSPSTVHPLGILFVFFLLYVLAIGVLTFFIFTGNKIMRFFNLLRNPITFKTSYFYASVLALAPVIFVCMRSIGNVGIYEFGLIILFEVVAFFYIAKHK